MPGENNEAVMVHEKSTGHLRLVDPGTGAVLHGLMNMLSEVLEGLDRRMEAMEGRVEALAVAITDATEAPAKDGGLADDLTDLRALVQRIEGTIGERIDQASARTDEAVQGAITRRLGHIDKSISEARGEAEATAARIASHLDGALESLHDELTTGLRHATTAASETITAATDTLHQRLVDQAATAKTTAESAAAAVVAAEAVAARLTQVDAAVAALPGSVSEQIQSAMGSWRNRLRRGETDESVRKLFEDLGGRLSESEERLADGLVRIHEAVNRSQGEALESAQSTSAEVARLVDQAAQHQLDAVATVAERLVAMHDEVLAAMPPAPEPPDYSELIAELAQIAASIAAGRRDAAADAQGLATAIESLPKPIAPDNSEVLAAIRSIPVPDVPVPDYSEVLAAIRSIPVPDVPAPDYGEVLAAIRSLPAPVPPDNSDVLAAIRSLPAPVVPDNSELLSELSGLGASVAAGRRDAAAVAQGLPDLIRRIVSEADPLDLSALSSAVEAVQASVAEQGRAVLDAVTSANTDHQDVLQALHSSLAKRFDARSRALAETLDGLATSLEAARTLGPSLDKVSSRLDAQQPYLDQIRHQLVQLAATVTSVPADVERRHNEATASLAHVTDALGSLRKHAAALDRAVQQMKASQEGLATAIVDLRDGNGVVPQRLDQIGAAVQQGRKQIAEVGELTRSVAGAVEQQQAMGSRLAELVTQVRASTRSDIERVESSIHLEVLKQHQQDQARLTQAVAGVSEVVEREAGVIAQRVSALANEVDAIRLELAGPRPEER